MSAAIDISTDASLNKLVRMLGPERASALVRDTLRELGLRDISSPDDRLRFGVHLMKKGGLLEAIGRAIKVQAILLGATDE
jgi:hypothetical protein